MNHLKNYIFAVSDNKDSLFADYQISKLARDITDAEDWLTKKLNEGGFIQVSRTSKPLETVILPTSRITKAWCCDIEPLKQVV